MAEEDHTEEAEDTDSLGEQPEFTQMGPPPKRLFTTQTVWKTGILLQRATVMPMGVICHWKGTEPAKD